MANLRTAFVLLAILLLPVASAEIVSTVDLTNHGGIEDIDLGINAAKISPSGTSVILVGAEGYAHIISAEDAERRENDIELNSGRNADFNDVAWHPQGQTALLVGDQGMVLRYAVSDHSLTNVNGSVALIGENVSSIDWRSGGDFAYVASDSGRIWRFQEGTGFIEIENSQSSSITDVECHPSNNICLVSSLDDGIGIIDRDHTLTWLGGTTIGTWIAIDCADPTLNECVALGSGLSSKVIEINAANAGASTTRITQQFGATTGDITGVSTAVDGTSIIHLAPFGTIRHVMDEDEAYGMIVTEELTDTNADIAGKTIVAAWETEYQTGYILTSFGEIIEFETKEEEVESSLLLVLLMGAIIIAVPGSIIGLIFMNSTYLQKKYKEWRMKSN